MTDITREQTQSPRHYAEPTGEEYRAYALRRATALTPPIRQYYRGTFGEYGTMQACRQASIEHAEWIELSGRNDKSSWQDKHQSWIYEPVAACATE